MKKIRKILLTSKIVLARLITINCKKDKWLICEKPDEARDNGYYYFKYCMENSNNKRNIYYVIDKKSIDIKKIIEYKKNIIYTNSIKHCIYYFKSNKLISSQAIPFPVSEKICRAFFPVSGQKFYWLQHGITMNYLKPEDVDNKHKKYSLICCASPYESKFFQDTYGYSSKQAICTGFCRFDGLKNEANNYILIMPTFRKWLTSHNVKQKPTPAEEISFIKSDFYINYSDLLTDKNLLDALKQKNIKVILYLHYALQNYSYLFKKYESSNIIIASREDYDVQDLLKKSKLMVTDFSSVFFDFAYMNKPVVYFQFDKERFTSEHYKKGYFSFEKNGFGPVIENYKDVSDYLIKSIANDFIIEEKYMNRIHDFFPLIDRNNCKRIYEIINND